MQFIITNTNTTITENTHPFISKSDFLLAFGLCHEQEPVAVTLPTTDQSIVHLILAYLQYGCLPHRTDTLITTDLERCLCYLGTDDVKLVSFSDSILNKFTHEDRIINRSTELLVLYSHTWDTEIDVGKIIKRTKSPYPVILQTKRIFHYPQNLNVVIRRVFQCQQINGTCRRAQFVTRVFELLDNVIIAGGCLQFMLSRVNHEVCNSTDIDFFLVGGDTCPPMDVLVHQLGQIYQESFGNYFCMRTEYAVTFFKLRHIHRNVVQFILKRYPSVEAVLSSFDIDASCFAYDGSEVVCNQRGYRAWITQHNTIDVTRQSPTYVRRLLKYHRKYGFGIVDPGFVSSRLIPPTLPLTGLASLMSHKDKPVPYGSGYSEFSVCDSCNMSQLIQKIQKIVNLTKNTTPFVLRYKNSNVFVLNEEEKTHLPTYDHTNTNVIFQYPIITESWYAQAYGLARNLPPTQIPPEPDPPLAWVLYTGKHKLGSNGVFTRILQ